METIDQYKNDAHINKELEKKNLEQVEEIRRAFYKKNGLKGIYTEDADSLLSLKEETIKHKNGSFQEEYYKHKPICSYVHYIKLRRRGLSIKEACETNTKKGLDLKLPLEEIKRIMKEEAPKFANLSQLAKAKGMKVGYFYPFKKYL